MFRRDFRHLGIYFMYGSIKKPHDVPPAVEILRRGRWETSSVLVTKYFIPYWLLVTIYASDTWCLRSAQNQSGLEGTRGVLCWRWAWGKGCSRQMTCLSWSQRYSPPPPTILGS